MAATPTFWTVSTQADFLKGDVEDLSIDSDGRMFPGPSASLLAETAAPFLWTVMTGAGRNVVGRQRQRRPSAEGRQGRQALDVLRCARARGARARAGAGRRTVRRHVARRQDLPGRPRTARRRRSSIRTTSTSGRSPSTRRAMCLPRPATRASSTRSPPTEKATRFYKTNAGNVVSLAFTKTGELIAGTESPGRVFRIDPSGKAFVLLESPFREIHAVRLAEDGTIYAVAVNGTQGGESRATDPLPAEPARPPVPSVSTEITAMTVIEGPVSSSGGSQSVRPSRRAAARGAIYRIRPDGLWDAMWDSGDDAPYDLVIEPSRQPARRHRDRGQDLPRQRRSGARDAAGPRARRGRSRRFSANRRDGSSARRAIRESSSRSPPRRRARGTYESDVRDAGTVASWGVIRWRATAHPRAKCTLSTRSGNTATPDETWSAWSKPYDNRRRRTDRQPQRALPAVARRARGRRRAARCSPRSPPPTCRGTCGRRFRRSPFIRPEPCSSVRSRPARSEIAGFEDTRPTAAAAQSQPAPPGAPPRSARRRRSAAASIRKACRRSSGRRTTRTTIGCSSTCCTGAKARRRGRRCIAALADPIFVWDTTSVPDGTYFIKVAASDAPSNSPGTALVGELESVSFDIDNTRADDRGAAGGAGRRTHHDRLRRPRRAVAGAARRILARREPLARGLSEGRHCRIRGGKSSRSLLEESEAARSVIIRATDAMNNVRDRGGGRSKLIVIGTHPCRLSRSLSVSC